jgi:hypothetical protein
MKKNATPKSSTKANLNPTTYKPPCKHELALMDLLAASIIGISKLTELPSYGETALPTTISQLGLHRGFRILRERRDHFARNQIKTYFNWYWLADQGEAKKAILTVNKFRLKRGVPPISESEASKFIHLFPAINVLEKKISDLSSQTE